MIKKVINTNDYTIDFEVKDGKNMITFMSNGLDVGHAFVDRDFGNYFYLFARDNAKNFDEEDYYNFFLQHSLYVDDFDSYSDLYKDINYVRPHYAQERWDGMVDTFRRMVKNGK